LSLFFKQQTQHFSIFIGMFADKFRKKHDLLKNYQPKSGFIAANSCTIATET